MDREFTTSDLVKMTDVPHRVLRIWADRGIIRATASSDKQGTGTHRLFNSVETRIAHALGTIRELRLPFDRLHDISKVLRPLIRAKPDTIRLQINFAGGMVLCRDTEGDDWPAVLLETTVFPIEAIECHLEAEDEN